MYYRQIHPDAFINGKLVSLAFQPSQEDNAVSTFDAKQISAEESFKYWIEELNKKSVGVMAVIDEELICFPIDYPYDGEKHTVTCSIKININGIPIPSHTNLIFPEFIHKNQIKAIQRYLCGKANSRGWIFSPEKSTVA